MAMHKVVHARSENMLIYTLVILRKHYKEAEVT